MKKVNLIKDSKTITLGKKGAKLFLLALMYAY
jgi:hypothetical protein